MRGPGSRSRLRVVSLVNSTQRGTHPRLRANSAAHVRLVEDVAHKPHTFVIAEASRIVKTTFGHPTLQVPSDTHVAPAHPGDPGETPGETFAGFAPSKSPPTAQTRCVVFMTRRISRRLKFSATARPRNAPRS